MSIVRKSLVTIAAVAGIAALPIASAAADEPVPDPTGTCSYDVNTDTMAGTSSCQRHDDVGGAVQVDGNVNSTGSLSGVCGNGSGALTVAGTPLETGDQSGCVPPAG